MPSTKHIIAETSGFAADVSYPAAWANGKHGAFLCYGTVEERSQPWKASSRDPFERLTLTPPNDLRIPEIWTHEIVIAWLAEAMATLQKMDGENIRPDGIEITQIAVVRNTRDAYGAAQATVRTYPTAEEITRYDYALPAWLMYLENRLQRKIVCSAAVGLSFRAIGRCYKISHEWARQMWWRSIGSIVTGLNATA